MKTNLLVVGLRHRALALPAIAASLLVGCGSYPAPTEREANTVASVRAAQEVGAQNDPQAALHLKLAQEQLDQAKQMISDGDNQRAEYVLMRADADAELAVALAREASMKAEAQQVQAQVKDLQSQQGK